ncbi:MAG: hypothetical protein COA69_05230 [Robiginitomaculum sp.]|nr:MAG: hypothetical protein COA69_05230 [Robiginitomaculum sp.]
MEELRNQVAENLPEPLLVFDARAQTILWINPAAEIWLQRSCETVSGKSLVDISPDFDELFKSMAKVVGTGETVSGHEMPVRLRGNRKFVCSYQVFPCSSGWAALIRPKQKGRSTSTARPRGEAVTMLGRMLAHELKNPLAGIRGAAQLLEADLQSPDDLELTCLIKEEVDRIGRLADQMERFGTSGSGHHEPFNVHTVLRKATLLFQSQDTAGIDIEEFYDPSLPLVYGDSDALMQVVVNLVANAVEAIKLSSGKGRIKLQTRYRAGVRRRNADGESYTLPIEVRIIDDGPGIDKELRERVFHPFVTGKANGHGLGLALVSKIVAEHGGIIDLETEPGRTVFSVLLPTENNMRNDR